jgi:hypothetical protein
MLASSIINRGTAYDGDLFWVFLEQGASNEARTPMMQRRGRPAMHMRRPRTAAPYQTTTACVVAWPAGPAESERILLARLWGALVDPKAEHVVQSFGGI